MSKIETLKTCERCGKEFSALSGYAHFCDDCKAIVIRERLERSYKARAIVKQNKLLNGIEGIDYVIDLWNGLPTTRIPGKWFKERHPGRTIEEYLAEFPDAQIVCKKTSELIAKNTKERMNKPGVKEQLSKRYSGAGNPNSKANTSLEQRQRISPFSKSFKGYDNLSDEEKEVIIKSKVKTDDPTRMTTSIEYWLKKGYTEEEAKEKLSERQRTFTLEKCIEKYGEEKGLEIWRDRQFRWQINFKHLNYSKISQELFWNIFNILNDECYFAQNYNGKIDNSGRNHEMRIKTKNSSVSADFYYPKTNSIIEFDGDYWHSDTRQFVNKQRDIDRDNSLISAGYNRILHIKESDYRRDKDEVIQRCINFLKQ